jgi:glycolate oxidase FAD binding subunit
MRAIAISGVTGVRHFYDWGGGLIFLALPAEGDAAAAPIRAALKPMGGHATLMRAPLSLRAAVDGSQPKAPALAALVRRGKGSCTPT